MNSTYTPKKFRAIVSVLLLSFHTLTFGQFEFTLNGTATQVSTIEYQLTVDNCFTHGFTVGSMWQDNQLDLNNSFDITYRLMFGGNSGSTVSGYCANGNGADGIIFALQRNGTDVSTVSDNSLGLKIGGMTEAFGIEFDTFENGSANDPWYDHMAIFQDGYVVHGNEIGNQGYVQIEDGGNNVEDNAWHLVRMVWDADNQEFEAYVDCDLRLTYSGDMINDIFGGNSDVYYGFIGVNGFHVNRHAVQLNLLSLDLLNDTICLGETVQMQSGFSTSSSFAWHATNGDNHTISNTSISNPVMTPERTTTYVVNYNDGCNLRSDTSVVVVHDIPSLTVSDAAICAGASYNLEAGETGSYLWSTGATTENITISAAGNYALTFTDGNNCETTADMDLTVNSNPSITLNDASVCTGIAHTLDAGGGFTYNWSNGATTQTVQVTAAGNYAVTITDGNSCTGSDDMDLSLYANPSVTLNDQAICVGTSATLDAGNGFDYVWSNAATTQTINANTAGNYGVTITDGNGCQGEDDMTLTVNSNPSVTLNDAAICAGDNHTLDAGPGFTYAWSNTATTQTIQISTSNNYAVTITDGNGCSDSDDMNLTVNSNPTVTIADAAICSGSSALLDAGAGFTYDWSNGASTQTVNVSTAGNYSVTITDGNSCEATDGMALTVNSNPTVALSDAAICTGNTHTLDAGAGFTYNWTTGANSQTISPGAAGNYGVTITDGNGCTDSDNMTLTVNSLPSVSINDAQICDGESQVLDAGAGFTYLWSDASNNQTLSASTAGVYSVTITDGNGCQDDDNMTLTVNANPSVTLNDAAICSGNSLTLDAGAGFDYAWSTGASTRTISAASAGNYEVTITDGSGCEDVDDMDLTINSNPSVTLNDAAICQGDAATLNAGAGYSYAWSNGSTTQTINIGLAANYGVTITDGNGCSGEDDMTLTVNPNPSVTLVDGAICSGDDLTLDAGAGYTYLWSTGSNNQTINVSVADNYAVTITDGNGCKDNDDMNLTVNANLVINLPDAAICDGETYNINPGTSNSYNYTWSNGATTTSIDVTNAGNYEVTVTDGNSCSGSDDMDLTVHNNPSVTLNDLAICAGSSTNLSAGAGYTYAWSTGTTSQAITASSAGSYSVTITNGNGCQDDDEMTLTVNANPTIDLTDAAICADENHTLDAGTGFAYDWSNGANTRTININSAGNYSVTITDGNLCSASDEMTLTVNALPLITLNDASICAGSSYTLDAGSGFSYNWSTNETTQTIDISSVNTYGVTITNGNGCSNSDDMALSLYALPVVTLNDDAICAGDAATISADPGYTYAWSTGNNNQSITANSAGAYSVTITDGNGCKGSDGMTLTVNTNPTVNLSNAAVCSGNSHLLDAGAGFDYFWSTSATTQTISVGTQGVYEVTITDGNGCSDSDDMTLTVNANPTVNLNDQAICDGETAAINAGGGYSYVWSTNATNQSIVSGTDGDYSVTITDGNGCSGTDEMTLSVNPNPVVNLDNAAICAGSSQIVDAGAGFDYLWSNGNTTQTIAIGSAGNYRVTITDGNNCTDVDDMNLTVHGNPSVTLNDAEICQGYTTSLNAGAGFNYTWSTGSSVQSITIGTANTYAVTITDGNGCTDSDQMTLTVNSNPSITLNDQFICAGENATIDALAGYTYLWSNGTNNQSITTGSAGNYSVTITDGNGCQDSDDMTLTVYSNPTVTLNNQAICSGASTSISAGSGFTYNWNTGSTTQSITAASGGNYSVTITDGNNCSAEDDMTLSINSNPTITLNNATICQGETYSIDAGAGYLYQWSTGVNTPSINVTLPNIYSVTITDGNGCKGSDDMTLTVHSNPSVTLNDGAVCDGDDQTLDAGAGYTYLWSTGSNNQTITIDTEGTYGVTITDGNGCQDEDDMYLTVNDNLILNIPDAEICDGELYTISSGTGGGYQYTWSTGASTEQITTGVAGNYAVTVTDGNACNGSDDMTLTVHDNPSIVLNDAEICEGSTVELNAGDGFTYLWNTGNDEQYLYVSSSGSYGVTITNANDCQSNDDMLLTVHENPSIVLEDATICNGESVMLDAGSGFIYNWSTNNNGQTITVNTTGNYSVTITDSNGCVNDDEMNLVVNPTPSITLANGEICADQTHEFDAGAGFTYLWSTGATTQTLAVNTANNYGVTITNGFNCSTSDDADLIVNEVPIFTLPDIAICQNESGTVLAPAGYPFYAWSNGGSNQTTNLTQNGTYALTVTNIQGCTTTDDFTFTIHPLPVLVIENDTVCQGETGSFNAPEFVSYLWSTGATTQEIVTGNAGGYQLTVTDDNGCSTEDQFSLIHYDRLAINPIQNCNATNTAFTLDFSIVGGDSKSYTVNGEAIDSFWSSPLMMNGSPYRYVFKDDLLCDSVVVASSGNMSCDCSSNAGSMSSVSLTEYCGPVTASATHLNDHVFDGDDTLIFILHDTPVGVGNVLNTSTVPVFSFDEEIGMEFGTTYYISAAVTSSVNGVINLEDDRCTDIAVGTPVVFHEIIEPGLVDVQICAGATETINAGDYQNYQWSDGSTSSTILVDHSDSIALTVTNDHGCMITDEMNVELLELPVISLNDTTICETSNLALNAGDDAHQYLWTRGYTSNAINVTSAGEYAVTATNAAGCAVTASMELSLYALPEVTVADVFACEGEDFEINPGSYSAYQWSDGSTVALRQSIDAGSYSLTVTDANGCSNSDVFEVVSFELPKPQFEALEQCAPTGSILGVTEPFMSYTWNTGSYDSAISLDHDGIYAVTVTDVNGCQGSISSIIDVIEMPELLASVSNSTVCDGRTTSLVVNVNDAGNNGPYSISLSLGDQMIDLAALSLGDNQIELTPEYADYITLTHFEMNNGCLLNGGDVAWNNPSINLADNAQVNATATGVDCYNGSAQAQVSFELMQGATPWTLTYRSEGNLHRERGIQERIFEVENATASLYEVIAVIDGNGCFIDPSSDLASIEVMKGVDLALDTAISWAPSCEGATYYLYANGNNLAEVIWQLGNQTSTDNPAELQTDYNQQAQITLIGKSENCTDTLVINDTIGSFASSLRLNDQNVLTPNGDGMNDLFEIDPDDLYAPCSELKVFNRWGTLIYEAIAGETGWDGSGLNGPAPEGTYYVVYNIVGQEPINRSITLYR